VFDDLFYSANFSARFKVIVKNSHFTAHTWIDCVFHITPYDCLLHGSEYPNWPMNASRVEVLTLQQPLVSWRTGTSAYMI